jgi:hypothetical protein
MPEIEVNAPYKYTFPITKAFLGEDGRFRLVGAATGPEVDLERQRVHPSLIEKWISQINTGQIEVSYDDNHKTPSESITSELGQVEKAWKDDDGHMMVQVVLDEDNPVAQYIHKAAGKGKQYGMSIFGKATRFIDEVVSGQMVRTILDGTLTRIAHTTRPVWTPSLGTVLSKAVDSAVNGDTQVADKETETEVVEKTTTEVTTDAGAATTDSGAATAPDTGKAPDSESAAADAEPVEKAVTPAKEKKSNSEITKMFSALQTKLREAGLLDEESEDGGQESTETKVEKSETTTPETDGNDKVAKLQKSVDDLTTLVTSLADHIPDGTAPGVLRKSEPVDPLAELTSVENPIERLRLSLAALHGEDSTTR